MKNKNKIIKTFLVFITLGIFLYTNATDINVVIKEIKKEWPNLLKVDFDSKLIDNWVYTSDAKIFKDLLIEKTTKDTTVNNKIILSLFDEIKIWNTYNIFAVFWVEWNADFTVEEWLNIKILSKETEMQWINKITLKDKKTIELYFKTPLIWNEFEFKWLEDLKVTESKVSSWSLILKTFSTIENSKDYIMIFMSLADNLWNNYLLSESIYNFNTGDNTSTTNTDEQNNVILNELIWNDSTTLENNQIWKDLSNLDNKLTENLWNVKTWSWDHWNIEHIAITAKSTPDTGPETWILMLLTLIINSIYFLTRKFSLQNH